MSRRAVTQMPPLRGYARQIKQLLSRNCAALCFSVTKAAQRDEVALVKPPLIVLCQRYDVMYRQSSVCEYPRLKAHSAAMEIAL